MTKNVEPTTEELIAAGEITPPEPTNEEELESPVEVRVLILETRIAELERQVFVLASAAPSAVASELGIPANE